VSASSIRKASSRPAVTPTQTRVVSKPIPDPGDLLSHLPTSDALCWTRGTDGFVAWGDYARLHVSGPDRFTTTAQWWRELTGSLQVDDQVGVPGSGPVAFASFTFDDGPSESVVIVPRVVIGRRDGAAWLTTYDAAEMPPRTQVEPRPHIRYSDGHVSSADYESAVAEAIARIEVGDLEKVVLARDLLANASSPVDARALLPPLSHAYPSCWTFAIEGLVGSTPELLVRRTGDHIVSRVLAGTSSRSTDVVIDAQHAAELLASDKDREEHELAVRSVAQALAPFCSDLVVPRAPEVVRLANVQHLQTDVTGRLANGESALDLAAALHPTAAVCGTPTGRARQTIRELEAMDRGRYAGPVGWLDARGDGAFGIALRCAQIDAEDPRQVRMFAGCGIVRGSEPVAELHESQAKLLAIREALEPPT
jgi:menaquinone-specific isochorismate synthase